MKNVFVFFILISGVALYSCKKNAAQSFWNFQGTKYEPAYSSYNQLSGGVTFDPHYYLSCHSSVNNAILTIVFANTTGNPPSGQCQVIAYDSLNPPTGNQVFLNIANGSFGNQTHYFPTGNPSDQVQVYMNNGKVAVKGTGIHLVNSRNASDNGIVDFDVTQTD